MTDEPGEQGKPGARNGAGAAKAENTLERGSADGSALSASSPFRLVFVIVPLLVIVAVGTNLLGLWTTSFQQAAREERLRQAEPRPLDEEAAGNSLPADDAPARIDAPSGAGESPAEEAPAEAGFDATVVAALVAEADPADGAATFKMCGACHSGEKDAPAKIGPNLWGVVGRPKAALPEFRYSQVLRARGGAWSYEELAQYIHDPRKFAPGTSMAFRGISENEKIADLIAYLRTLSDNPEPLPN